jgi:hypothetical protein
MHINYSKTFREGPGSFCLAGVLPGGSFQNNSHSPDRRVNIIAIEIQRLCKSGNLIQNV